MPRLILYVLTARRNGPVKTRLSYNLTHRTFGHDLNRVFLSANIEQVVTSILDFPKNGKVHIDYVLVARKHKTFFQNIPFRITTTRDFARAAKSNIDAAR